MSATDHGSIAGGFDTCRAASQETEEQRQRRTTDRRRVGVLACDHALDDPDPLAVARELVDVLGLLDGGDGRG